MSSWLNYFGLSSVSDSTDDAEAKDIASEKAFLEESIKMTDKAEAAKKITENSPAAKTGAKATVTTTTTTADNAGATEFNNFDSDQEDIFNDVVFTNDNDVVSTVPLLDVVGVPAVTKPQDLGAKYLLPNSQEQDEPYWEGVTLAGAYYHVLAMYMTTRMTTRMTTHTHRPD